MSGKARITAELKRRLYYSMLLQRRTEEKIVEIYGQKEMRCPTHLYIGHEAIAAGVCAALRKDDLVYAYYRSHGWYLSKGGDIDAMMSELMGRENGCAKGWGGSMHLIDLSVGLMGISAIVGGTISHAAGAALAMRIKKKDSIVVSDFGDGAAEEGTFHESLNMAALYRLPVIFVSENNLYATNTHIRQRQARTDIFKHAERFGVPGVLVDGNDVLAVHDAAVKAVERARKGKGPTLLECRTYRLLEHCGMNPDYQLGYRTQEEIRSWEKKGPLKKGAKLVTPAEAAAMRREIDERIDKAFAHARSSPFPKPPFTQGAVS